MEASGSGAVWEVLLCQLSKRRGSDMETDLELRVSHTHKI